MNREKIGPKYFEELELGEEFVTPTRTITETDVVYFSAMTGDYNGIHTSKEIAKDTSFGKRLVQGLLGLSISHGLLFRLSLLDGTAIAFLEVKSWEFKKPIFIGDTVKARVIVEDKRKSESKSNQGIIWFKVKLLNQDDTVVQEGTKVILMKTKE